MMNCTILSIYIFLKHINNISMYSLTCCATMNSQILCYTSQNKKHFKGTPAQPILMAAMLVYINSLLLESIKQLFYDCLIVTITRGLHQY